MTNKDVSYYMNLSYVIELQQGDEGEWYTRIPLLKGCMTDGDTQAEALANLDEAKELWFETMLEMDGIIPEPKMMLIPET